jgi:hypothetical protein
MASSGPDKDRKGWFGIGLKADHPDPKDPGEGPDNGPPGGPKGPLGGPTADDGPLGDTGCFAGKTSGCIPGADDSGPKNQKPQAENPREEKVMEKTSASSASSASWCSHGIQGGCWLCQYEIQRSIDEGTSERWARREVLGEDHNG